jgi:DNA-binding transcriptional MerR regulator
VLVVTDYERLLAAGLTIRQVHHWTDRGYLRPDQAHPGPGNARSYTRTEHAIARLMVRLTTAGMTAKGAHRVARAAVTSGLSTAEVARGITITIREER